MHFFEKFLLILDWEVANIQPKLGLGIGPN